VNVAVTDLFRVGGQRLLDDLELDAPYAARVTSLRRLIDAFTFEIDVLGRRTAADLHGHRGFHAIQAIEGWVRSWRRCSSQRSATCTGSPARSSCARGPG